MDNRACKMAAAVAILSNMIALTAGCGKHKTEPPSATSPPPNGPEGLAIAGPDCSHPLTQSAPKGQPADDIIGIRIGAPEKDARSILGCANPVYLFQTNGADQAFDLPPMVSGQAPDTSLVATQGKPNGANDKITLYLLGLPGEEKVVKVQREMYFERASEPSALSVRDSLVSKYGPPSSQNVGDQVITLEWIYDPEGNRMDPQAHNYQNCGSAAGSLNSNSECGLTEVAEITRDTTMNKDATFELNIGISNQRFIQQAYDAEKALIEKQNAPTGAAPKL